MSIYETTAKHSFNITDWNYNACVPIQKVYKEYVDLKWIQILFGSLYCLVLLLAFVANSATLYCLLSKSYQLGLNVKFLVSLNLSDLFIGVTSLPITAIQTFTRKWLWGVSLCRYVPLFQGASFFINSFTLVAIAIERYLIIARDTSKGKSKRHTIVVSLIWVIGVFASLPYALYMDLRKTCAENSTVCLCGEFCEEHWPHDTAKLSYGSSAFFVQFVLPVCVLSFCYWRVGHTVARGVKRRLNKENLSLISRQRLIRRKKRTANITMLLFMCFVVPWLPVNVLNLLRDYKCLPEEHVSILFAVSHLIAMTSILWNPIIYCWYNKQFLDTFRSLLTCNNLQWLTVYSSADETCQQGGGVTAGITGTTGNFSFRSKAPSTHLTRIAGEQRRRSRLRSRLSTMSSRRSRLSNQSINKVHNDDTSRICFEHLPLRKAVSADPPRYQATSSLLTIPDGDS